MRIFLTASMGLLFALFFILIYDSFHQQKKSLLHETLKGHLHTCQERSTPDRTWFECHRHSECVLVQGFCIKTAINRKFSACYTAWNKNGKPAAELLRLCKRQLAENWEPRCVDRLCR